MKIPSELKKRLLLLIPCGLIFWIADKLGMVYRLSAGTGAAKLTNTVRNLPHLFDFPPISIHGYDLLFAVIVSLVVLLAVYLKSRNAKKYRKGEEYGSARWGTPADLKPFMDKDPRKNLILTQTEGLTMNSRPKNPKYARSKNVIVYGGSGSGKTRFFLKPQLMQLHSSYVVTDSNGNLQ